MNRLSRSQSGYTLIELIIAMGSASALMVGLSGSLLIASYALDIDEGSSASKSAAEAAMARLTADTRHALKYSERSPDAIEFIVPDRNGDDLPETLRYEWGGVPKDPILRTLNGGTPTVLLKEAHAFSLTYTERLETAVDVTVDPDPKWPVVESFSLLSLTSPAVAINLPLPAGVVEGELLVAGIAVEGNEVANLTAPAGWSLLDVSQRYNKVTLGVWWKNTAANESLVHQWQWGSNRQALGWIVRVSNQYAGSPITSFTVDGGNDNSPPCPAATSTLDHSLVLRLGAFEQDDITIGDPGLAGHTPLLMEASNIEVSGGCGYKVLRAYGESGEATFDLTSGRRFRTLTLIVAPAQE